jgi:hypothetical protein
MTLCDALFHVTGKLLDVTRVFDIPERPAARQHRFDVIATNGDTFALAAATFTEKMDWLEAFATAIPLADLSLHPRAVELQILSRTRSELSNIVQEVTGKGAKPGSGLWKYDQYLELELDAMPQDHTQMPDVFVHLYDTSGHKRVSFFRITAEELLAMSSGVSASAPPQWVELEHDWSWGSRPSMAHPGLLLFKLQLEAAALDPAPLLFPTRAGSLSGGEPSAEGGGGVHGRELFLSNCDMPTSRYSVQVNCFSGRELPASDSTGLLDPYLAINLNGHMHKTKHQRQTRDPHWFEAIVFDDIELPQNSRFAPLLMVGDDAHASNTLTAPMPLMCRFPCSPAGEPL